MQLGPHPGSRPLGEPAVSRSPRRTERCRGHLLPRASRRRHEHDRGQHLAVTVTAPTATLRPRRRLWHHPLKQLPQLFRHQPFNNPHHGQQSTEPIEMASKPDLEPKQDSCHTGTLVVTGRAARRVQWAQGRGVRSSGPCPRCRVASAVESTALSITALSLQLWGSTNWAPSSAFGLVTSSCCRHRPLVDRHGRARTSSIADRISSC